MKIFIQNMVSRRCKMMVQSNNCESTVLQRGTPPSGITWYWQSSPTGTSTANSSANITRTSGTRYYLRARNNSTQCWSSSSTSVNYTINTSPSTPSAPTVQSESCESTVLQRGTPPSGITWYWQSSPGGTSTANSGSTITRSSGTRYYLRARNNSTQCWSNTSSSVNYSIEQAPRWYADADGDGFGDSNVSQTSCNQPTGYVSNGNDLDDTNPDITNIQPKNFYRDADGDGFGDPEVSVYQSAAPSGYVANGDDLDDTNPNITNVEPQYFYKDSDGDGFGDPAVSVYQSAAPSGYVDNADDQCPGVYGTLQGCPETALSNENYIYTKSYVKPRGTTSTNASDYMESITYFDGLGRPMQNIAIRGATDGKDIVTHVGYDDYGRKDKEWLAYHEPTGSLGSYRGDVTQATQAYYKNKHASDFAAGSLTSDINAYSEINYEDSPLNRVLEQGAPGADWAVNKEMDTDHTISLTTRPIHQGMPLSNLRWCLQVQLPRLSIV